MPVSLQQTAVRDQCIDITGQRQSDDISVNAVDYRPRLLARAAMRLLDAHLLAGLDSSIC